MNQQHTGYHKMDEISKLIITLITAGLFSAVFGTIAIKLCTNNGVMYDPTLRKFVFCIGFFLIGAYVCSYIVKHMDESAHVKALESLAARRDQIRALLKMERVDEFEVNSEDYFLCDIQYGGQVKRCYLIKSAEGKTFCMPATYSTLDDQGKLTVGNSFEPNSHFKLIKIKDHISIRYLGTKIPYVKLKERLELGNTAYLEIGIMPDSFLHAQTRANGSTSGETPAPSPQIYSQTTRSLHAAEAEHFKTILLKLSWEKYEISGFWRILNANVSALMFAGFGALLCQGIRLENIANDNAIKLLLIVFLYVSGAFLGLFAQDKFTQDINNGLESRHADKQARLQTLLAAESVEQIELCSPHYFEFQYRGARPGKGYYIERDDGSVLLINWEFKTLNPNGEVGYLSFQPNTHVRIAKIKGFFFVTYLGNPVVTNLPEFSVYIPEDELGRTQPFKTIFSEKPVDAMRKDLRECEPAEDFSKFTEWKIRDDAGRESLLHITEHEPQVPSPPLDGCAFGCVVIIIFALLLMVIMAIGIGQRGGYSGPIE